MENENKLYLLLGEMSADIKNILKKGTEQDARLDNHSQRITVVERFQWKLVGIASGISGAIAVATKFL